MIFNRNKAATKNETAIKPLQTLLRKSIRVLTRVCYNLGNIDIAMSEIDKRASSLAEGAVRQKGAIETINSTMDRLTQVSVDTSENAAKLSKGAELTHEKVQEKRTNISETIENFFAVKEELQQTVAAAKLLSEKSAETKKLIASIEDICLQTNILAINASIEAARAGTAGKGFAVVAQEIRGLSLKTEGVSDVITQIIEEIHGISENATTSMQGALQQISEQAESLNQAVDDLKVIEESTKLFSLENAEVSKQNEILVEEITSVRQLVNEMQEIVNSSAAATEEVSRAIAQQTSGLKYTTEGAALLEKQLVDSVAMIDERQEEPKELILATSPYAPFVIYDEQKDVMEGIDIDLAVEAFRRIGVSVRCEPSTWDGCLYMLEKGIIDMIPAFSENASRNHYVEYSKPYREGAKYSFFTRKDSDVRINRYEDLKKYKIGIQDYVYNERFDSDTSINKIMGDSNNDVFFNRLLEGHVDAVIINEYSAKHYLHTANLHNQVQQENLSFVEDADNLMAFAKLNNLGEYAREYSRQIEEMKKDGTYDKIEKKYLNI